MRVDTPKSRLGRVDRNSDSLMVISFALEASLPGSASLRAMTSSRRSREPGAARDGLIRSCRCPGHRLF